jgi:hypothetical protein
MLECIKEFEDTLDAVCDKESNPVVLDMWKYLTNLTFVSMEDSLNCKS